MNETSADCKDDSALLRDELLHELFETTADRRPGRTAVQCGESSLTYRELDEASNRLARALRARGIGREDRVGLLLPRSEQVYLSMLGILKAGAAYVPIDQETPLERIRFILKDSGAKCLITRSGLAGALAESLPLICLDVDAPLLASQSADRIARTETKAMPGNLCYVIYTSGTTGQPKGVQIEHRQAAHLVRAESQLYGIEPQDRVFQLASPAFDASVEEIWMAFFHGATLVSGTAEMIHSGPEFSIILERLGVTVLSCVPTFLSMLERDISTVRVLILGGEVCPAGLADRWQRSGRTIWNTYGPTETTVIATAARLVAGHPVTIGRPIANYGVFLLDESGRPVPDGAEGEICISGPGVSRGYLNRPELQKTKFIETEALTGLPLRLYRTGDQARLTLEGDLEYRGRLDDQVKVRGFRVELSEIEAALTQVPEVIAAAAAVHQLTQQIAAYVVIRPGYRIDRAALRQMMIKRLPAYMVPAYLDEVPAIPVTTSGKIDRTKLPEPQKPMAQERRTRGEPTTEAERMVLEVWQAVLHRESISLRDNFFLDLDGHSLLAAAAVSKLRQKPGFERLSVGDLYAHPTVGALARLVGKRVEASQKKEPPFTRASNLAYRFCTAGQALGVLLVSGIYAWQWLGAFLAYGYLAVADWPVRDALLGAFLVYLVMTPAVLALSILLKWLLLGRIRPGRYPLWGWFYWRFWFVRSVVRAAPVPYLAGTPFLNVYYRLMGARIGQNVFIGSSGLATFDVLSVGDCSSIGVDTTLDGASVEGGMLKIASVTLGRGSWVGNRSSLGANSVLEDGSGLDDLSMLPDGARVPAGELWRGSPATPAGRLEAVTTRPPWSAASGFAQMIGILFFPLVTLAGIFPGLMAIVYFGHNDPGYFFLVGAPLVALSFVVFLCLEVWIFKWLFVGRIREGCYPVGGSFHVRLWFFDQLMDLSLEVIGTFYTTLYLGPWLKALGARIGPRSEISTVRLIHPDLLSTGAECFLADDVMVGTPHVRSGWITIGRTRLGDRVFVGNSAVLPAEIQLGSQVLIGALSIAPQGTGNPIADDTTWFGSPPIALPARQKHDGFLESETYRPPRRLVALRLAIEFVRILLPSTLFVILASLIVNATDIMQDHVNLSVWLLTLPVLYALAGFLSILATLILKVLLIGRYREDQKPLWCSFVWRTELLTGVYENLCVLFFLNLLRGTPYIAWVLRAFGMRIGRRCYVDTTWFTEFDLVDIGDEAALNDEANIQTHLFEDRIMKMGPVRIGARCAVGTMSTVLYSTHMEDGSCLEDLSLLMKGETLPAGTRWRGIPARHADGTFPPALTSKQQ